MNQIDDSMPMRARLCLLVFCLLVFAARPVRGSELETYDVQFATETGYIQWFFTDSIGQWFERYKNNPLDIPIYQNSGVVHPDMQYFPEGEDGYKYWMFYTPFPPENLENPCLARSNDGIHFTNAGISNPLIKPTEPWEHRHLADEDVLKVGSVWYMYYAGRTDSGRLSIGVATSADGKTWVKYAGNPVVVPAQVWENDWVGAPTVYHDGQKFWMWFAAGYTNGIELASSPDGFHWTRENSGNPVMTGTAGRWDAGGVSHPDVTRYQGMFWMYYWGFAGTQHFRLGLARSEDKVHWFKSDYNVVLDTVQNSWEGTHIYRASPVIVGDTMMLYYSAYDDVYYHIPHIGLAKSYTVGRVITDLLPGSCPNMVMLPDVDIVSRPRLRPVGSEPGPSLTILPMAILGSASFDARQCDPATVRLEGVAAQRWEFKDVGQTAIPAETECDCSVFGTDSLTDLMLYFDAGAILDQMRPWTDGESRRLHLTGRTQSGGRFWGSDCLMLVQVISVTPPRPQPASSTASTELRDCSPNPFNAGTSISYSLDKPGWVSLAVYNILGRKVRTLVAGIQQPGSHVADWDGRDDQGASLGSGAYLCLLRSGEISQSRKMILMK